MSLPAIGSIVRLEDSDRTARVMGHWTGSLRSDLRARMTSWIARHESRAAA